MRAIRAALPVFAATRASVLVVGFIGLAVLGCPPGTPCRSDDPPSALTARWDAGWYLGIASDGYRWLERTDAEQNIVFFPAYPMAIRGMAPFVGGRYVVAGAVVSFAAFFWALIYLYRLAREDVDHDSAVMSLVFLATYPFAVFFSAVYTESLYLLCATATFYHFRRHQPPRAAAWGFVLGLTRPTGFLASVPLALAFLGARIAGSPSFGRQRSRKAEQAARGRMSLSMLLPVATPLVGLLCYCAFNYWLTGDPLAWVHAQRAWGRGGAGGPSPEGPDAGTSLVRVVHDLAPSTPMELFDLAAAVLMAVLVVPVTRRFGLSYGAFVALLLLLPIASGNSQSLGRYTSVLFPAFIYLGERIPPEHRAGLVLSFAVLQGIGAVLFFSWRPFL